MSGERVASLSVDTLLAMLFAGAKVEEDYGNGWTVTPHADAVGNIAALFIPTHEARMTTVQVVVATKESGE